jgi:uncharacterized membrane protein YhaH (DUF805 family)
MRGVVSAVAPDGTYGQIAADDGQRYSYWTSEVRNGPVEVGAAVNFEMAEGQPVDIFVLPRPGPDLSPRPLEEAAPGEQPPPAGVRGYAAVALARFAAAAPGHIDDETTFPSVNYWLPLYTSTVGRISRRQFWLHGALPIFLAGLLFGWIPVVGYLISIALMWASICIAFKRFHDVGYPGWYSLAYLVPLVGAGVALGVGFFEPRFLTTSWQVAQILAGLGGVVALAQLMFVYVRVGQEGPNQYGPDPLRGF